MGPWNRHKERTGMCVKPEVIAADHGRLYLLLRTRKAITNFYGHVKIYLIVDMPWFVVITSCRLAWTRNSVKHRLPSMYWLPAVRFPFTQQSFTLFHDNSDRQEAVMKNLCRPITKLQKEIFVTWVHHNFNFVLLVLINFISLHVSKYPAYCRFKIHAVHDPWVQLTLIPAFL